MRKTAVILACAALVATGCAVRTYQSYPTPVPAPVRTGNSIYGVFGLPYQLEYQRRIDNGRWDVICGGALVTGSYTDTVYTGTVADVNTQNLLNSALFGGFRFWASDPDKSGPGLSLYSGVNAGINNDTDTWIQLGVEAGLAPGIYTKHVVFAVPLKLGYGLAPGGDYAHAGAEGHLIFRGEKITTGAKLGIIYGIGAKYDALLIHIPVNLGLYFGIDL